MNIKDRIFRLEIGWVIGVTLGSLLNSCAYAQQAYSIGGLSAQDIQIIGTGLDKLPRELTDQNQLYQRIQAQITQQAQAAAKGKADADKATLDKAVAEALAAEKAKTETKPAETKSEDSPP